MTGVPTSRGALTLRRLTRRRARLLEVLPRSAHQLHTWLRFALDLDVPRTPMRPGADAPFEYLIHTFFEDRPAGAPADCVVWANRGGGKTFLGAVATALDLLFKPGIEVRILGGSLEQSQRMHEHLRTLFERPSLRTLLDGRVTERRVRLTNGSRAAILAQSHTSVRGCRPQKLRCDEVELFDPEVWRAAQLVTRSRQCGDTFVRGAVEALSTMHRAHGLMADILTAAQNRDPSRADTGSRRVFRWSVIDTLETCPPARLCKPCALFEECAGRAKHARGFYAIDDAVRAKQRAGETDWRAEMLCERPNRDDLVLPEFDANVHVAPFPPPADATWIAGMDFGFRNPTVILHACVDEGGVLRIIDERSQSGVVLEDHIRALLDAHWPAPAWIGVDPAGRQRNDQTGRSAITALRRAGLVVRDRRLPIEEGLRLLRARLAPASGGPRLFIHPRCETLVRSLQTYHYPAHRPESRDPVKDGADHAVDALRYLVANLDRPWRTTSTRYI